MAQITIREVAQRDGTVVHRLEVEDQGNLDCLTTLSQYEDALELALGLAGGEHEVIVVTQEEEATDVTPPVSDDEGDPREILFFLPTFAISECFLNSRLRRLLAIAADGFEYAECPAEKAGPFTKFMIAGPGIYRYDEMLTHDEVDGPRNGFIEVKWDESSELGEFTRVPMDRLRL